ncbi:hypothetical protein ABTG52_19335, partial [Acinetobacter baumannii]
FLLATFGSTINQLPMATALARRAAVLTRLSTSTSSPASLVPRRGFADHHGPQKFNVWDAPKDPGNWKEEQFVIVSLTGWGLAFYGAYKFFTGGKKSEDKKLVVEAAKA